MKVKIKIKHWITDAVLFEFEKENNTLKDTLLEGIRQKKDLRGSDLRGSDLSWSDLSWSNLRKVKNLDSNKTDFWWHIHHEQLVEYLTEPIRARINCIKKEKAKNETPQQIKLRLKLLKPVLGDIPEDEKGWKDLHKKECKNCPWDGKSIFPNKK